MEAFEQREHGPADLEILVAVMALALATWMYLPDAVGVPLWKSYVSVTVSVLLTLAAPTRHPYRAASIRLLAGGWVVALPYLLGFSNIEPASRAYLLIGPIVAAVSIPALVAFRTARIRLVI